MFYLISLVTKYVIFRDINCEEFQVRENSTEKTKDTPGKMKETVLDIEEDLASNHSSDKDTLGSLKHPLLPSERVHEGHLVRSISSGKYFR